MTQDRPSIAAGSGAADEGSEEVRAELARRTRAILDAPRRAADPAAREREKRVVSECRYLMRLLSVRRRSEGELRARLDEREVPADLAHEVMARTRRAGLIDDAEFAREWIAQRRARKGLSDRALREELQQRGVSSADQGEAFAALAGSGPLEEDPTLAEEERCRELVRERLRREAHGPASDPRRRGQIARRLDAYLRRRGYEGSLAVRVISSEMRAREL